MTLENVHVRHAVPFTGAASPADFAISGTQILLHRSTVSGKRVWPVVTQAGVTGPNVVLHFKADEAGVAPHQRWATGLLVDSSEFTNGTERRPGIAFSTRAHAGSGPGWAGMVRRLNVKTDVHLINAARREDWRIGAGPAGDDPMAVGPTRFPDSRRRPSNTGVRVTAGLYLAHSGRSARGREEHRVHPALSAARPPFAPAAFWPRQFGILVAELAFVLVAAGDRISEAIASALPASRMFPHGAVPVLGRSPSPPCRLVTSVRE